MEVTRELVLGEPLEDVWSALTDAERLAEWFANEVELVLEPGGAGVFRWEDGEVRYATVEEVDVGRRFAFRWYCEEAPDDESVVAFELEEVPDGTRVTVTESTPAASAWACALELRAAFVAVA